MNIKIKKNKLKLNMDIPIYVIMKEEYSNDDEAQLSYVDGYFLRENEAINNLLENSFTEDIDDLDEFEETIFYVKNNGINSCIARIIKLENKGQREFNFPLNRKSKEEE